MIFRQCGQDSLAEVQQGETDVNAASGTRHFAGLGQGRLVFQPEQIRRGNGAANQEVEQDACHD